MISWTARWPAVRFIARRTAGTGLTLLLLTVAVFVLVKLIPGDEARVAAGADASPAAVALERRRLGLDHSVLYQFFAFLGRLLRGDLGTSSATNTSVASGILKVLPATLELVVVAVALIVVVAVPLALLAALRAGSTADRRVGAAVVFGAGLPTFWVALLAQYWLGARLHLFPISGELGGSVTVPTRTGFVLVDSLVAGDGTAFVDAVRHLILPASILALSFGAQFYRACRTELSQVVARDFVLLGRAKGLSTARLAVRHIVPNAAGPALTVLGVIFGNMVGGAILVESVFGLPGVGAYLTNAVSQKDTFAVLGGVLVIGVVVVLANLAVDVVQLARDPRLRSAELAGLRV